MNIGRSGERKLDNKYDKWRENINGERISAGMNKVDRER